MVEERSACPAFPTKRDDALPRHSIRHFTKRRKAVPNTLGILSQHTIMCPGNAQANTHFLHWETAVLKDSPIGRSGNEMQYFLRASTTKKDKDNLPLR